MLKLLNVLFLTFLFCACASTHRETTAKLRHLVMAGRADEAIKYLNESPLAQDNSSKLLYFFELGLLEHYQGNYPASNTALNSAKELLDELYTTKATGKIKAYISNDNADFYYGEKYEASLIYFYLALNYYMQANLEPDAAKKKALLLQARSEILGWDSFLTEMKNERLGEALFKEDLLAKTFGALVHEAQGNFKDDQIALQLYKDANDVFFKNYNLFPTFNSAYESFRKNFRDLPKMPLEEVEGKYVLATPHNLAFKEFLTGKILKLTKKVRPQDLKAQITKLKPGPELLKKIKSKSGTVSFLVQEGLIVEKTAKKYEIPMDWGGQKSMAFQLGAGTHISYELPHIEHIPQVDGATIEALNKEGKVIASAPLSVIAPLGDLAAQAVNEHSAAIAAKTAARVISKHLTALGISWASYEAYKKKDPKMALFMATLGHAALIASINEGEKADIRFWSTLPSNIRMGELTLPAGTYKFRAIYGTEGLAGYRVKDLGTETVKKNSLKFVMENPHLKRPIERNIAGN